MIKLLSLLVLFSMLVAIVDSTAGLRFKADPTSSYAEFTGWSMSEFSELQFYFKTGSKKPAILLYQDNGVDRDTNDYLEVSLVKHGHVRLQLRGDRCSKRYLYIRRNFTDNSWHKLKISRHGARLNLSVDNVSNDYITCVQPPRFSGRNGKAQSSLFMGGIPLENAQGISTNGKWALTGLFLKILQESRWEMVKGVTWNCGICVKFLQFFFPPISLGTYNIGRVFWESYFEKIIVVVLREMLVLKWLFEVTTDGILIVDMK